MRSDAPARTFAPAPVPVMVGTLLGLELLLARPALDLRAACDLLREDPGALLHLFRMIGEEYGEAADRPLRLEDCIASLPVDRLLQGVASAISAGGARGQLAALARHGVLIGSHARSAAESLGLGEERAYLVGVLHELGSLPRMLCWPGCVDHDVAVWCDMLSQQYKLPYELRSALNDVHRAKVGSVWVAVIAAAHDLARTK